MENEREKLQHASPVLKNMQNDYFTIIEELKQTLESIQEVDDTGTGGYIEDLVSNALHKEYK